MCSEQSFSASHKTFCAICKTERESISDVTDNIGVGTTEIWTREGEISSTNSQKLLVQTSL